jgi:cytoskeletal protein RodZ
MQIVAHFLEDLSVRVMGLKRDEYWHLLCQCKSTSYCWYISLMNKIFVTIAVLIFIADPAFAQAQERASSKPQKTGNEQNKSKYQQEWKESEEKRTKEFEQHRKEEATAPEIVTSPQTGVAPKTEAEEVRARQKASMSKHMAPRMKPAKRKYCLPEQLSS